MAIEIDQSGKVENTQTDTILAYSNKSKKAIIIPAGLKRRWFFLMATERKTKRETYLLLFSAALFFLLKDIEFPNIMIVIDREYPGHERDIKAMLMRFFSEKGKKIKAENIHFKNIGKKSPAHKYALEVFRERDKADEVVSEKELFGLF